jgi:hypothetical protein
MDEPIGEDLTWQIHQQELLAVSERAHWKELQPISERVQIRSNAEERERGAVLNPDAGSRAIDSGFAKTPVHTPCENTNDPGSVPHLRQQEPFQMSLDADTDRAHPHR